MVPTLAVSWARSPSDTTWWITLGWVLALNLVVGAFLSVLPLPLWPFLPEQGTDHYFTHVTYAVAQIPALVVLWQTRPRRTIS